VGKSLKEALLEQLEVLRERGLAPSDMPAEEEHPAVVYEAQAPELEHRGRAARRPRVKGPAARPPSGKALGGAGAPPRNGPARPIERHEREERGGGGRERRQRPRGAPAGPLPVVGTPPSSRPQPAGGPAPRDVGRSALLQQRAEQRKRDTELRELVRIALSEVRTEPVDEQALIQFLDELSIETGALPPLNVVVEALRAAGTDNIRAVGDQIRAYYRRPRAAQSI